VSEAIHIGNYNFHWQMIEHNAAQVQRNMVSGISFSVIKYQKCHTRT